jgi:hypothetical protein
MHRYQQILNVRRIDCRPTDILRRVRVCVVGVSASHTFKLCLAFSVSFIDTTARSASARSVARIDEPNGNTGSLGFVEHKALPLIKRPAVQTAALLFTSPYPNADSAQVFQSDPASGALCSTNYLFRNYVVHIGREPLLFTATTTQQTFCRFRAFLLQLATQPDIACSFTGHRSTRESLYRRWSRAITTLSEVNADRCRAPCVPGHQVRQRS